ncbi:spore coat U domain-containing protein [Lysobacter sp. KIS68-7]|uniref:Csu type fimbrial protein n=1 Tax=Lysobacter sp. KIS68-7 TaxID=2904252 RepID=UPI001E37951F|nr:spore coat U domain-containing protein [Lysobacter sp. KIS68-7]UHQ18738.1 spore coat U domain-containing protein [Lysobacter sp. KIS68-7]
MRSAPILLALATALVAANASAATVGNTFQVTATVSPSCVISTPATGIAFGTYDSVGANASTAATGSGSIKIRCTKGTAIKITLDEGLPANKGAGSTCGAPVRQMASGTNRLGYQIYSDSGRSVVWGCTLSPAAGANDVTVASSPNNAEQTFTTYGSIPGGQDVANGSYADTVGYTVNF